MSKLNSISKGILTGLAALVLGAAPSRAQLQPDEHTVALYHFDEGSGTVVNDISQYSNHGTFNGSWNNDGVFGGSIELDGIDDFANVPISSSLYYMPEFTVEGYFRFRGDLLTARPLISKIYSFHFVEGNEPQLHGTSWTVDDQSCQREHHSASDFIPEVNRFYHMAFTSNGIEQKIWIDRQLVSVLPAEGLIVAGCNPLQIGTYYQLNRFFQGSIDEVRISNIARDFNQPTSVPENYPNLQETTWGRTKHTYK